MSFSFRGFIKSKIPYFAVSLNNCHEQTISISMFFHKTLFFSVSYVFTFSPSTPSMSHSFEKQENHSIVLSGWNFFPEAATSYELPNSKRTNILLKYMMIICEFTYNFNLHAILILHHAIT